MSLAHHLETVPAFPLGQPVDGRERYSMTPEQAALYRWLLNNRPHDGAFLIQFREIEQKTAATLNHIYMRVQSLVERGWLKIEGKGRYSFVQPIRHFKAPR